jgi:cob(I)alamin adenosyltransferase
MFVAVTPTRGLLHYYYGTGPGKTSVVIGRIVRALGRQKRPVLFQFLKKHDPNGKHGFFYGEYKTLTESLHVPVLQFGSFKFIRSPEDITPELIAEIQDGIDKLTKILQSNEYDLIIIDEIGNTFPLNLVIVTDFVKLITRRTTAAEIMMTGRQFYPELAEISDYVVEINEKKHPFTKGIMARPGIEF